MKLQLPRSGITYMLLLALATVVGVGAAWAANFGTTSANYANNLMERPGSPAVSTANATLVSNLGQVAAPEGWELVGPENRIVHAQAINFTTGPNENGYSVSAVTAWMKDVDSGDSPQVNIYGVDDYGNPAEVLYELTNPASFSNEALNSFSAPADAVLAQATEYVLVFENVDDSADGALYQVGFVGGNSLDANGAAGWSIDSDEDYVVLFKIDGRVVSSSETPLRSPDPPGSVVTKMTVVTVPENLSVFRNDRRITAQWEAATDDGAKVLTGYRVQWKASSARWRSATEVEVSAGSQAYTITGLSNDRSYDVRVAAEYDGSRGAWSAEASGTPRVVKGAPKNLEVRGLHDRLKVSWEAPDQNKGHTITGYLVEWKSGSEAYDPTRQQLVANPSKQADPLTIRGVAHGVVHVVRVSTMSDSTTVGRAVSSATPVWAKPYIEANILPKFEDDHPWVRQAWSNRPLYVRVGNYKHPGFYVFSVGGLNGFRGLVRGLRYGFSLKGYRSDTVVLHEIAHHFTLDPRVADVPGPVGVGWLYFSHRVKGDCPVGEIYPDVITYYTRQKAAPNLGYLSGCPEIGRGATPDRESVEVAGSVVRGEIPDWFYEYYDDGNGDVDLDAVWTDLRSSAGKRTATYMMRNMFGGFCSVREANWAISAPEASFGNPWKDGGCHWRKPQDMAVISKNGALKVNWKPHLYETGPSVTHYAVQWRSADQDYSASRQVLVSETDELTHTVEGLTDGVEHFVRVVAVNEGSPETHVDNDGHSRSVEGSTVPGRPGAPSSVAATGGDHHIALRWEEPVNSEIELSGYVVEWKSGTETYSASRTLEVSGGSTRTATITGLRNSVIYTVRVTAESANGTMGTPSRDLTAAAVGPPEAPSGVKAVGGKNSLLVSWQAKPTGSPWDAFVIQWRTGGAYQSGHEKIVWAPGKRSHLLKDMAGHGRYYVRVLARNSLGRSEPSGEYFVMSGAPGKPRDVTAVARPGGGFHLTWDRPDPYYPNNPDFRPVRNQSNKRPIRDGNGNTVPQFRYDVEYRLAGDDPGPWCSKEKYQDLHRGYDTLDPAIHQLDYKDPCANAQWVIGQEYNFRIRAAYVWLNSGDTNVRNGPWQSSGRVVYDPSGNPPDTPTGVQAVGGKESLLVMWDRPTAGTPADDYLIQWRTGADFQSGDNAVASDPSVGSRLLNNMAGHGRYYVRIIARNVLGESEPSDEFFVMSGAPGQLTDVKATVRTAGGFTLTWDRPDPYYPNNSDFRPVRNFGNKRAILDSDGNTVPQYRYDIEYKLADGQPDGWCSQDRYRDVGLGNDTLDRNALNLKVTGYCSGAEPVVGERYNLRIRASYVWLNSGDTNPRNGPWAYSGPVEYNLSGGVPNPPTGVEAVGGKESLLVSWAAPSGGGTVGGYIVQWRTGENYKSGDNAVVGHAGARSRLLEGMAGHGRYYVRIKSYNILGESEPSKEYFVMSGAPGAPTDLAVAVRPAGGFTLTWDRPDPYYPNNPDFRPVRNFKTKRPILDGNGNTVPQFRYDVEYKQADGQPDGWCSKDLYRNIGLANDTLSSDDLALDLTNYCSNAEPVVGEEYNFRIRAAYVWRKSGDTNARNGPWKYSGPVLYNPTTYSQN